MSCRCEHADCALFAFTATLDTVTWSGGSRIENLVESQASPTTEG